jgi:hypothetical protein
MSRFLRYVAAAALLSSSAPAFAGKADKAAASGGKKTVLVLNIGPDPTEIYVDGKKKGTSDKIKELPLEPGNHVVRLVHGGDEHEDMVTIKKGQSLKFEWKFEDDKPKPATPDEGAEAPKEEAPKQEAPKPEAAPEKDTPPDAP